jgi:hypothetical protein
VGLKYEPSSKSLQNDCRQVTSQSICAVIVSGEVYPQGRRVARAKNAQATPTQSHISPSIIVFEDSFQRKHVFQDEAEAERGCGALPLCPGPQAPKIQSYIIKPKPLRPSARILPCVKRTPLQSPPPPPLFEAYAQPARCFGGWGFGLGCFWGGSW